MYSTYGACTNAMTENCQRLRTIREISQEQRNKGICSYDVRWCDEPYEHFIVIHRTSHCSLQMQFEHTFALHLPNCHSSVCIGARILPCCSCLQVFLIRKVFLYHPVVFKFIVFCKVFSCDIG